MSEILYDSHLAVRQERISTGFMNSERDSAIVSILQKLYSAIKYGSVSKVPKYTKTYTSSKINSASFRIQKKLYLALLRNNIITSKDLRSSGNDPFNYISMGEAETVVLNSSVKELPENFAQMLREYTIEEPFVCEIKHGILCGQIPVAMTKDNRILLESSDSSRFWLTKNIVEDKKILRQILFPSESNYEISHDSIAPFVMRPSRSYYHWLLEYLPRLKYVFEYNKRYGKKIKILLHPESQEYVFESLGLLGVSPGQRIFWDHDTTHVGNLILPSHYFRPPNSQDYTPLTNSAFWLRTNLLNCLENSKIDELDFSRRVFLSRQDASSRRVINRSKVEDVLADLGFESYALGNMEFLEGVALFNQADIVVAPHGGGLANLLFSADAHILELLNKDRALPGIFALATQMNLDYSQLICSPVGGDLYVDTDELTSILAL